MIAYAISTVAHLFHSKARGVGTSFELSLLSMVKVMFGLRSGLCNYTMS